MVQVPMNVKVLFPNSGQARGRIRDELPLVSRHRLPKHLCHKSSADERRGSATRIREGRAGDSHAPAARPRAAEARRRPHGKTTSKRRCSLWRTYDLNHRLAVLGEPMAQSSYRKWEAILDAPQDLAPRVVSCPLLLPSLADVKPFHDSATRVKADFVSSEFTDKSGQKPAGGWFGAVFTGQVSVTPIGLPIG